MYAAGWGCKDIVKILIYEGANIDIEDNEGKTAYDWADNREIEEIIRQAGLPGPKVTI
jgi:ankyrin repeat protein